MFHKLSFILPWEGRGSRSTDLKQTSNKARKRRGDRKREREERKKTIEKTTVQMNEQTETI